LGSGDVARSERRQETVLFAGLLSELEPVRFHTHLLLASIERLALDPFYIADLDGEIEATARAYVGAAVTEIASLRAEWSR
jgi:hypothetical protein